MVQITITLTPREAAALDDLNGNTGAHAELAKRCESARFRVEMDAENNDRSWICLLRDTIEFWDTVVGEIRGDEQATIVIYDSARH